MAISIDNARLYEENIQATRLATIGQTVAGISHCIKNILTGIKGGLSLIEIAKNSDNHDVLEEGWGMPKRNIDRISLLVLDMLDYSKERSPLRQKTNIDKLIDDVYQTIKYKAEKEGITFEKEILGDVSSIPIDQNQIFRCLVNLVTNAIESMPNSGDLVINVSRVNSDSVEYNTYKISDFSDVLVIKVFDTGEGIAPEHLSEIFAPFFSTKGTKGTGLGLAVTKKIIEEHKGKITVESTPHVGTIFTVILPIINE